MNSQPPDAHTGTEQPHPLRPWHWLAPLIPCALLCWLNRSFLLDDALIYARYIRNFLSGHGLTYNPGELFNALSSPLFSMLSLAGSLAWPDPPAVQMLLSALFLMGALALLVVAFARHMRPEFAMLGGLALAFSRYPYHVLGMETSLMILLAALCLVLFQRGRTCLLCLAGGLMLLVRGETLFLLLPLVVEHFRQKRSWPRWTCFLAPVACIFALYLFYYLYYGSPLPSTLSAKMAQGESGLWGSWPVFLNVAYHTRYYFLDQTWLLVGCIGLALLGTLHLRGTMLNRVLLPYMVLLTIFYTLLNIPNYHWYYAPYYFFGFMYMAAGCAWLLARFSLATAPAARTLGWVLAVAVMLAVITCHGKIILKHPVYESKRQTEYPLMGRWLAQNTEPEASVALVEIGIIGYYSERRIIDILGLVTPAHLVPLAKGDVEAWYRITPPDYVLVHIPVWPHENGVVPPFERGELVIVEDFPFNDQGYRLLRRVAPASDGSS